MPTTRAARRSVRLALLLVALAGARPLAAQVGISAACAPGIADCTQLRFTVNASAAVALSALTFTLDAASPFRFEPAVSGGVAIYQAQDDLGPFGGPALVGAGGLVADLDFLAAGFPFTLAAGHQGFVDLTVANPGGVGNTGQLAAQFVATSVSGAAVSGVVGVVPEPATVALLASGLTALALATRRRRRGAP